MSLFRRKRKTMSASSQSNWFSGISWVTCPKSDQTMDCMSLSLSWNPTAPPAMRCSPSKLLHKLTRLKRQLMPAAEKCAKAVNDKVNNHKEKRQHSANQRRTTPQWEFRLARSRCNPYEYLGKTTKAATKTTTITTTTKIKNQQQYLLHQQKNNKMKQPQNNTKKRQFQDMSSQNSTTGVLSSQFFINRSAVKLANLDALLNFSLTTSTSTSTSTPTSSANEQEKSDCFTFVDLCGAPGGFSEYLMYRCSHPPTIGHSLWNSTQSNESVCSRRNITSEKRWNEKNSQASFIGFGMSLIGANEDGEGVPWDLSHIKTYYPLHLESDEIPCHSSRASLPNQKFYICKGEDGTGSIYNWNNVRCLSLLVEKILNNENCAMCHDDPTTMRNKCEPYAGVHLVVADGGFDAQRDSQEQEAKAIRIVTSQTAAALTLLQPGGQFVLKMFGFQEQPTQMLLHYLNHCFHKMTFLKPISSRPASAERYLVCCGYNGRPEKWDGLSWRDEIFKMQLSGASDDKDSSNFHNDKTFCLARLAMKNEFSPLSAFMDSFDSKMLQLNTNSCRSIIADLNQKKAAVEKGTALVLDGNNSLNIGIFEQMWQLQT